MGAVAVGAVVKETARGRVSEVAEKLPPAIWNSVPSLALALKAFTLTVPTLMAAHEIFIMVPGQTKADAVVASLEGPLTNSCPASILRTHAHATVFLDRDSAARVRGDWPCI